MKLKSIHNNSEAKVSVALTLVLSVGMVLSLLMSASTIQAAGFSIARSAGMAGAHVGLASGASASYYNPANLGLVTHRQTEILLAGVGLNASNNSFSLADYNNYTGSFLTDNDKQDILNKVPLEGLIISADAEASAMGVSFSKFSFNMTGFAASEANLGHDVLETLLYGNSFGDTISLNGMYGSGWSYGSADFSFGTPIYTHGNRQLAVGLTAHYIKGLYFADVTKIDATAATLSTGFTGDGEISARTAEGGSGYAVDLGVALDLSKSYTVGLNFKNFASSINWDKNPQEQGYTFSFDSLNINNSSDSAVISSDFSRPIASFKSGLPSTIRAGIAKTSGKFIWALDWEQGFKRAPGASSKPQISLGAEYSLVGFLPLRAGYSFGGRHGSQLAVGTGIRIPLLYIDAAVMTTGGTSASSNKGAQFALSAGLNF